MTPSVVGALFAALGSKVVIGARLDDTLATDTGTVYVFEGLSTAVTDADGNYTFTGLAAGAYRVREVLQDDYMQTAPSGNGSYTVVAPAGGNVTGLDFGIASAEIDYPVPLEAKNPLGSLIYDPSASGIIHIAGATQRYVIGLDDAQTITVAVDPDATLRPTVELLDPASTSVGTATAGTTGEEAVLQVVPTAGAGIYTIVVGGEADSTGQYTIQLVLNAAVEEEQHDGAANDDVFSAQDLDASFFTLGSGSAERAAVLGRTDGSQSAVGPDGFGYEAVSVPYEFEDISATGQAILVASDDGHYELWDSDLNGFQFDLYGTTFTSLFVNVNGLLTFEWQQPSYDNSDLTGTPAETTIAPLWDDLTTCVGGGAVYYEVRGSGDDQRLIVQWEDVNYYHTPDTDLVTFQVVLSEADGTMQFNYLDLSGDSLVHDEGASATVGIKGPGPQGDHRLLVSHNDGTNGFIGSGQSALIGVGVASSPQSDWYRFTLADGDSATLVLCGLSPGELELELYDSGVNLLAVGSSADNLGQRIGNFAATGAGTYLARVLGRATDYSLLVLTGADFDAESNNDLADAQELTGEGTVLGHLAGQTPDVPQRPAARHKRRAPHKPGSSKKKKRPRLSSTTSGKWRPNPPWKTVSKASRSPNA